MMGRRQKLKGGLEHDVVRARQFHRTRPKTLKFSKRKLNKRFRRELKECLKKKKNQTL